MRIKKAKRFRKWQKRDIERGKERKRKREREREREKEREREREREREKEGTKEEESERNGRNIEPRYKSKTDKKDDLRKGKKILINERKRAKIFFSVSLFVSLSLCFSLFLSD